MKGFHLGFFLIAFLTALFISGCRGGGEQGESQVSQAEEQEQPMAEETPADVQQAKVVINPQCKIIDHITHGKETHVTPGGKITWTNNYEKAVTVVLPAGLCQQGTLVIPPRESRSCEVDDEAEPGRYEYSVLPCRDLLDPENSPVIIVDPPKP
jgi:hypothetical protein